MEKPSRLAGVSKPGWIAPILTLLLFAFALAFYLNTLGNEFTNWDDNRYITENPLIRNLGIEAPAP